MKRRRTISYNFVYESSGFAADSYKIITNSSPSLSVRGAVLCLQPAMPNRPVSEQQRSCCSSGPGASYFACYAGKIAALQFSRNCARASKQIPAIFVLIQRFENLKAAGLQIYKSARKI